MNFKKTVAIAAAAGALAAVSVPAMAFENEFHGLLNFNTTFSNFQNGASGDYSPAGTKEKKLMNNYIEQRARLQYIAKASDDLKMVTHFEINNRFGNINTVAGTKGATDISGSDIDTDGLTLVTKHVYLDFNVGKDFNAKLGLMPYKDTIKGLFIDADVPAIYTTSKFGAYTLGVGFSRFSDDATASTDRLGGADKDLFILDNTFTINKDTKAALSYYFYADYTAKGTPAVNDAQDILLSTFALSGETKIAGIGLSGFAAMQAGTQKAVVAPAPLSNRSFHGYAANVAAKMAVGPGTARTAFLFTSGDNSGSASDGSNKGWVTSSVNSYNEGGMMILARSTANSPSSTDRYIRRNVTNIALLTAGYDANLSEKLYVNGNLGFAWTPASGATVGGTANSSDFMGTELNVETGYKLYKNLTLTAQAAYVMLGGLYKDTATNGNTPENLYSARLHAKYSF